MKIYAGRTEIPHLHKKIASYEELAQMAERQEKKPQVQRFVSDKVTFSKEGMRSAREMREYINQNGLNRYMDIQANWEELDRQIHTKNMDYSMNFLSEMQEVIHEEREKWDSQIGENSFESSLTLAAKGYQVVHDRIVDEFAKDDRETTYVIDGETGERREETAEDRLAELDHAYDLYTTFVAASKKIMAQLKKEFGGMTLPETPEDIEKNTKDAFMEAVSEKNLERLRQNLSSFGAYKPKLSIGSHWEQVLAELWKPQVW